MGPVGSHLFVRTWIWSSRGQETPGAWRLSWTVCLFLAVPSSRHHVGLCTQADHDGVALAAAHRDKERTYPELVGPGARARLVVLTLEVGGRCPRKPRSLCGCWQGHGPDVNHSCNVAWKKRGDSVNTESFHVLQQGRFAASLLGVRGFGFVRADQPSEGTTRGGRGRGVAEVLAARSLAIST